MATERTKQITGIPTGVFMPFAGTVAPAGFLMCDGAAVSRTTHAALFAVIGTAYGVGDGSTTFNIPDLRACTPVGAGTSTKFTTNETKTLGTYEDDRFQGHRQNIAPNGAIYAIAGPGGNGSSLLGTVIESYIGNVTGNPVSDGINGTPRTGNTTQGKQVVSNYIIKT